MTPLILVADDEENIRTMVCGYLDQMGFRTLAVSDGFQVLDTLDSVQPDLVLLDVMMPGLDGFALARILLKRSAVPVLFMTARTDEIDRVQGLELGADDYVTKPFSLRELTARVQAVLRRTGPSAGAPGPAAGGTQVQRWKDLEVDHGAFRVKKAGVAVELTAVQF